jgi:hypothetical protein
MLQSKKLIFSVNPTLYSRFQNSSLGCASERRCTDCSIDFQDIRATDTLLRLIPRIRVYLTYTLKPWARAFTFDFTQIVDYHGILTHTLEIRRFSHPDSSNQKNMQPNASISC